MIEAWTDYPLFFNEITLAPIRKIRLLSYDQNKYVRVEFEDNIFEIKHGYIYPRPGRCGEITSVDMLVLEALPITNTYWGDIEQIFEVFREAEEGSFVNGKWTWLKNNRCKYISLDIDMRDGQYTLKDKDEKTITLEELKRQ